MNIPVVVQHKTRSKMRNYCTLIISKDEYLRVKI